MLRQPRFRSGSKLAKESISLTTAGLLRCRGEKLWRAKPAFPQHTPEGVTQTGSVSTVPFLRNAALQMLKQGCGEGWLLQPKILDMPDLEYRCESPPKPQSMTHPWNRPLLSLKLLSVAHRSLVSCLRRAPLFWVVTTPNEIPASSHTQQGYARGGKQ